MEVKELKDALEVQKAEVSAIVDAKAKEQNEELKKALEVQLKASEKVASDMQKQLDEMNLLLAKQAKQVKEHDISFVEDVKKQLTDDMTKIKGQTQTSVAALKLEVKSFLETANASVTTGALVPWPQLDAGISKAPDRNPFVLDLISRGATNALTIYWTYRKTRTDNSGFVTEGTQTTLAAGTVTESVVGYATSSASMQNLSAFIKASNNSLEDVDWLLSEIQTELVTLFMLKLDAALLSGTVAVNGFDGLLTVATAFAAGGDTCDEDVVPNKYDALMFAIDQVKVAHFMPDAILLHPSDIRDMKLERDGNGNYMLPQYASTSPAVDGVRIVSNTGMTKGSYLVGEFKKAKYWSRKSMELKVWEQNEDDAEKQLKTITLYGRGTMIVKTDDRKAFVTDTFAATIAEITHA